MRKARRRSKQRVASGWRTLRARELQILQAAALVKIPWLVHGFSTRAGGASRLGGRRVLNLAETDWDTRANVAANRRRFLAALGGEGMLLVTLRQIHSDIVHLIGLPPLGRRPGDAALTRAPGILLGIRTADCVPILLVDAKRRAIGAVHAGWRGTLRRVAAKALGRMRMAFGTRPADVVAVLGPGIGRCCYEVGPEVAQAYAGQFARAAEWFDGPFAQLATSDEPAPFKWLSMAPPGHDPPAPRVGLDLVAANRWQLLEAGVPAARIVASDLCTACRTDLFFSHRRERDRTGRMLSVIGIRL